MQVVQCCYAATGLIMKTAVQNGGGRLQKTEEKKKKKDLDLDVTPQQIPQRVWKNKFTWILASLAESMRNFTFSLNKWTLSAHTTRRSWFQEICGQRIPQQRLMRPVLVPPIYYHSFSWARKYQTQDLGRSCKPKDRETFVLLRCQ